MKKLKPVSKAEFDDINNLAFETLNDLKEALLGTQRATVVIADMADGRIAIHGNIPLDYLEDIVKSGKGRILN